MCSKFIWPDKSRTNLNYVFQFIQNKYSTNKLGVYLMAYSWNMLRDTVWISSANMRLKKFESTCGIHTEHIGKGLVTSSTFQRRANSKCPWDLILSLHHSWAWNKRMSKLSSQSLKLIARVPKSIYYTHRHFGKAGNNPQPQMTQPDPAVHRQSWRRKGWTPARGLQIITVKMSPLSVRIKYLVWRNCTTWKAACALGHSASYLRYLEAARIHRYSGSRMGKEGLNNQIEAILYNC